MSIAQPTARPSATTHACTLQCSHQCDKGDGAPKRAKCRHCGGLLVTFHGVWGCFVWSGTGRYPEADAISLHATERKATKATDGTELVVRWIPAN